MLTSLWRGRDARIATLALLAIAASGVIRLAAGVSAAKWPLVLALAVGGVPLILDLGRRLAARKFGSDLLAGLSILTAALLGEFLIAVVVILMLSGGQALEQYATRRASAVLDALARRHPTRAHRRNGDAVEDVALDAIRVGDILVVLPFETCPADGEVVAGSSTMDESYLSGEPFMMRKTVGASVMSGAVNQDGALTIKATRLPVDSRYARIIAIVRAAEERRPPMRRLADRLGAWYTPLAVAVAATGWAVSGEPQRFLAVLVIATPCPLLLAIPVAIIGGVSLAAQRSILIKDPAILERLGACRTIVFDKTGTLTMGRPVLAETFCRAGVDRADILAIAASLEQYSRHPLAPAVTAAAASANLRLLPVLAVSERPGQGLSGRVDGRHVRMTSRRAAAADWPDDLPGDTSGLECVVIVDGRVSALLRFRDTPRQESGAFVGHLAPRHGISRILMTSGDRESEVRYLASMVGITDVRFNQSPEQKVALVERETARQPTLFVGDGLNDAPAMVVATVAVALGQTQDVAAEAAHAVVLDGSLARVDELLHIAARTRRVALQSAVGGMALSIAGMMLAVVGWLPALAGAVAQEVLDAATVLNALRAAFRPRTLTDY